MDTKSKVVIALIAVGAAYVGYSQYVDWHVNQTGRYGIVAGPVTGSRSAGLNGTFRLVAGRYRTPDTQQPFSLGIHSYRLGGACIAFRAADLGYPLMAAKQCNLNSDCNKDELKAGAYCDIGAHQCWAKRPGVDLCNKSSDYTPATQWDVDVNIPVAEAPIPTAPIRIANNAQARVIACLNEAGYADCATQDGTHRMEVMGRPFPLP